MSQPRYLSAMSLKSLNDRQYWARRRVEIEVEVMRDLGAGKERVKRRGILSRASGTTITVGSYVYSMSEIRAYRRVVDGEPV